MRLDSLRQNIGLVSQDVFLFHGTVQENITYGTFDASSDQIVEAAKIAGTEEQVAIGRAPLQRPRRFRPVPSAVWFACRITDRWD